MKTIKLFGLPRSCTNLTTVLLRSNFKCGILDNYPCWKHGFNYYKERTLKNKKMEINDLKFVVCTKNPLDWLWSLFCFENETKLEIKKTKEEFLKNNSWHYKNMNPIEAYNILNFHWLTMTSRDNIFQFKFEDLQENQIKTLENIKQHFNLDLKNLKLKEIKERVNPGCKLSKNKFIKREQYWTKYEKYYIYKKIDKKTLDLCGYFLS